MAKRQNATSSVFFLHRRRDPFNLPTPDLLFSKVALIRNRNRQFVFDFGKVMQRAVVMAHSILLTEIEVTLDNRWKGLCSSDDLAIGVKVETEVSIPNDVEVKFPIGDDHGD